MIFNPSVDNSLYLVCPIEQCFGTILEEKKMQNFNGMNSFTFSKLKSKEFVWELFVQKVSKLKQAWLTLKGKVKKIRRCP